MTEETIRDKIRTKILDCCPDVEEAPQFVKDVYETAVDFFGEDRVDLQKATIREAWNWCLAHCSYETMMGRLGISPNEAPTVSDSGETWSQLLQNENRLAVVESLITPEKVLRLNLPTYLILIHFHDITVSNEQDESVKIEDIYAAVPVTPLGHYTDSMLWLRTTVTKTHWMSNYRHSHLRSGRGKEWLRPCLGSGPIRMTIETLISNCDLSFWSLFWLELSKCICVESLLGGPYIYMKDISTDRHVSETYTDFDSFASDTFKTCFPDLVDEVSLRMLHTNQLQYSFVNGAVRIATSYVDFTVLASNCLLEYFSTLPEVVANNLADKLMNNGQLIHAQIRTSGEICSYGSIKHYFRATGADVELGTTDAGFTFKGEQVPFNIVADPDEREQVFFDLIGPKLAACLRDNLTTIANYVYARKQSYSEIRTNKK